MQFFIIVIIIGLVFFLHRLYHLGNDDFVLLKKNVTLEQVFNCAIVVSLFALLSSRIFYVIFNPAPVFFSILGFLIFPYFPGLSLTGAVVGGIIALLGICYYRKFPIGRIFDFFVLSFLFVLPVAYLGYFLLSKNITMGGLFELIAYSAILIFASIYLFPKSSTLEFKDGTVSLLFIIFFSLISLLGDAIDNPGMYYFTHQLENYILLILLFISVILIIKQEVYGKYKIKNAK
jgi:prolipoprotein diacylglyceryltransferase